MIRRVKRIVWEEVDDEVCPRVRLPRMRASSFRLIEILRILVANKGVSKLDQREVFYELVRRGALDPIAHVERSEGAVSPGPKGKVLIFIAIQSLEDMGLIRQFKPEEHYHRTYQITQDGLETLADWDSTTSGGIYGREEQT